MATIQLPPDFKEFLRLLDAHDVDYLLIGGYAVSYYGYPRATGDMDIWLPVDEVTANRVTEALKAFGFDTPDTRPELFLRERSILRMGIHRIGSNAVRAGRLRTLAGRHVKLAPSKKPAKCVWPAFWMGPK
jgi:hypothetical protein